MVSPSAHAERQGLKKSPPTCERKVASPSAHAERQGLGGKSNHQPLRDWWLAPALTKSARVLKNRHQPVRGRWLAPALTQSARVLGKKKKKKVATAFFLFAVDLPPLLQWLAPALTQSAGVLYRGIGKTWGQPTKTFLIPTRAAFEGWSHPGKKCSKTARIRRGTLVHTPNTARGWNHRASVGSRSPGQWEAERGRIRKLGTEEPTGSTLDPAQPPAPAALVVSGPALGGNAVHHGSPCSGSGLVRAPQARRRPPRVPGLA